MNELEKLGFSIKNKNGIYILKNSSNGQIVCSVGESGELNISVSGITEDELNEIIPLLESLIKN